MSQDQINLSHFHVVRLNAAISPVDELEKGLYTAYGIQPQFIEANAPEEIITHVSGSDAILVVSISLTHQVIESLSRCRIISRLGIGTDKIDVERGPAVGHPGHQRSRLFFRRDGRPYHGFHPGAGAQVSANEHCDDPGGLELVARPGRSEPPPV